MLSLYSVSQGRITREATQMAYYNCMVNANLVYTSCMMRNITSHIPSQYFAAHMIYTNDFAHGWS